MKLDVVIPTYNRSGLLTKTIQSLLVASVPEGLEVQLLVIDNNSPDDTAEIVAGLQVESALPLHYIRERKQGLSHARNAGIEHSTADLLGFLDDDEEIAPTWFNVIAREFADPTVQFIGGPYLPNWVTPIPNWLPPGYHAAIGAIPPKPRTLFSKSFGANLMGGNAVIRREVFGIVGTYATHLGRSAKGLLSEEDAEFYRRLEKSGLKGMYVPDLEIYHYIAPERLTRKYHRRWVLWRAVSQGVLDRESRQPVPYIFGIPRYKLGCTLRALLKLPLHRFTKGGKGRAFANELGLWDFVGFFYGKHFFRTKDYYAQQPGQ